MVLALTVRLTRLLEIYGCPETFETFDQFLKQEQQKGRG